MKKKLIIVAVGALVVCGLLMSSGAFAGKPTDNGVPKGNELPSGKHYNLNIIAAKNIGEVGTSMGHTMFVNFTGRTHIDMTQTGGGFEVTDREGLTDRTTEFNIAPGAYDVYARPLGSPNGKNGNPWVNITATYITNEYGEIKLGTVPYIYRERGKPKTHDLHKLFYLGGEWIFYIKDFEGYYWDYDNNGLKLCQVRFYLNESY